MSYRNFLLALGAVLITAGVALSLIWFQRITTPTAPTAGQAVSRTAVLTAARALAAGTRLEAADVSWKEVAPGEMQLGNIPRGVSESSYLGAVTRRGFAAGEALQVGELIAAGSRRFLAAALRPGQRAVSIPVDAQQSLSGLVQPGDHVDVILTQTFDEKLTAIHQRFASETVLRDLRVLAVDQSMGEGDGVGPKIRDAAVKPELRLPRTVTLEVNEQQAQILLAAKEAGKLQLALHPLAGAGTGQPGALAWASDVSKAIREINRANALPGVKTATPVGPAVQPACAEGTGEASLTGTGTTLKAHLRFPPCAAVPDRTVRDD